jgi:hypothetical protein
MEPSIPTAQNPTQTPVPTQQTQNPTEVPMKIKKPLPKLPIIITIILIILALGLPFGAYLALGFIGIHPNPSIIKITP